METRTYTVYKFEELPEDAQKKALENYRDINTDYNGWNDFIIQDMEDMLTKEGYYAIELHWSGFASQGDGASFEAHIDWSKWIKKHKLSVPSVLDTATTDDITVHINQSGNYVHDNTMSIYWHDESEDKKYYDALLKMEEEILDFAKASARKFYKDLEEEYFAQQSDDAVRETLIANEYNFTMEGKID